MDKQTEFNPDADIDKLSETLTEQMCVHITENGWHETDDYDERIINTIIKGFLEHWYQT